ncbi:hypothetical protein Ciccas_007046 [Cichlidogyrus casuarinus]|uniref:Anoctamin n=1 Tax=Cichlidogyrus casuarinus TaxID=1844966 RepID=A0ABD2Q414_9PLAT
MVTLSRNSSSFEIDQTDKQSFFTQTERSYVIGYILKRASTDKSRDEMKQADIVGLDDDEIDHEHGTGVRPEDVQMANEEMKNIDHGIDILIKDQVFIDAYPLHTAKEKFRLDSNEKDNVRILLMNNWAAWGKAFKQQPIDYIRLYFGEMVGFYFAWLGYYTMWLVIPTILGIIIFFSGFFGLIDVCEEMADWEMCPICLFCQTFKLGKSCTRIKLSRVLDNEGTLVFAIFMALWATIFMEMWKREQFRIAYRWNVHELVEVEEPPRPEFIALVDKKFKPEKKSISRGIKEPHIPLWSSKVPVKIFTVFIILLSMLLSIFILAGVITVKILVAYKMRSHEQAIIRQMASATATAVGALLSLVSISVLTLLFNKVAVYLTDKEHHRTQSQYDDALTLKLYLLQFVNIYSSIFYVAFVQGPGAGLPGDPTNWIGTQFGCDAGDCLFELFLQMVIIMVGKQMVNFLIENTKPVLLKMYKNFKNLRIRTTPAANNEPMTTVISAFEDPKKLRWSKTRGMCRDAKKFLELYKRTMVTRANDIGVWADILQVLTSIAVRSNAFVIAFTSQYIQRMVYYHFYRAENIVGFDNYVNFTMSKMACDRFQGLESKCTTCYYPAFREPPESPHAYEPTKTYWNILAAKFIFIFVFENIVIVLTSLLAHLVPDVDGKLQILMRREETLTNEIIVLAESKGSGLSNQANKLVASLASKPHVDVKHSESDERQEFVFYDLSQMTHDHDSSDEDDATYAESIMHD